MANHHGDFIWYELITPDVPAAESFYTDTLGWKIGGDPGYRHIEASEGGTLCSDHVRYVPLGGRLANALIVRHELRRIFAYRQEALLRHFGGGRVLLALAADRR